MRDRGKSARIRRAHRERAHLFDPERKEVTRKERKPPTERPSDSRAFRKLKAAVLRSNPVCQSCFARPSQEVDHVTPIADGGDFDNPENLQALCVPCHRRKSAREARARSGSTQAQVGPDGLPPNTASHARTTHGQAGTPPLPCTEVPDGEEPNPSGILASGDFRQKLRLLWTFLEELHASVGEIQPVAGRGRRVSSMWGRLYAGVSDPGPIPTLP